MSDKRQDQSSVCEMIALAPGCTLEIFFHNYGHYFSELIGPFKTPGAAKLACIFIGKPFTVNQIEKRWSAFFKFDRQNVLNQYRSIWRNGGKTYRDTKKHVAYTGKIEDFGKR